jgi:hypothetical protein
LQECRGFAADDVDRVPEVVARDAADDFQRPRRVMPVDEDVGAGSVQFRAVPGYVGDADCFQTREARDL